MRIQRQCLTYILLCRRREGCFLVPGAQNQNNLTETVLTDRQKDLTHQDAVMTPSIAYMQYFPGSFAGQSCGQSNPKPGYSYVSWLHLPCEQESYVTSCM